MLTLNNSTPMSPTPESLLLVGVLIAPFGIRGQLKLRLLTDRPDHLQQHIRTVYVGKSAKPYTVTRMIEHKPGLIVLSLQGVDSREAAEDLRGSEVAIPETEAAPLEEGEYYIHQLYELRVVLEDGTLIGTVQDVLITGANEVLVVKRPDDKRDALIPVIHDVIVTIAPTAGHIVIRLMPGLIED